MTDWHEVIFLGALLGLLALSRRRPGVHVFSKPTHLPPEMLTPMRRQNWRNN